MTVTTETTTTGELTRTTEGLTVPTPATFAIDPIHSTIGFVVKHMMVSKVRGRFGSYEGKIEVDENLLASNVELTIDVPSIDTREENRDDHLRSDDFFSAATYPSMTFKST